MWCAERWEDQKKKDVELVEPDSGCRVLAMDRGKRQEYVRQYDLNGRMQRRRSKINY